MYRNRHNAEVIQEQEIKEYIDCEDFLVDMTQGQNLVEFEEFFPKALINEINDAFASQLNSGLG